MIICNDVFVLIYLNYFIHQNLYTGSLGGFIAIFQPNFTV